MLRTSLLISTLALLLFGLLAPAAPSPLGLLVIGGEYTLQPGETRSGDVLLVCARLTLAEGGLVDGNIRLFGSRLVMAGQAQGDIRAIGSQVERLASAQVQGVIDTVFSPVELPLCPALLLVIS